MGRGSWQEHLIKALWVQISLLPSKHFKLKKHFFIKKLNKFLFNDPINNVIIHLIETIANQHMLKINKCFVGIQRVWRLSFKVHSLDTIIKLSLLYLPVKWMGCTARSRSRCRDRQARSERRTKTGVRSHRGQLRFQQI